MPADPSGLLERELPLARLREAADAAVAGRGCVALVGGEAGIGKTSLVRRLGVHLKPGAALHGLCDPLETPRPLGPLLDVAADLAPDFPARVEAADDPKAYLNKAQKLGGTVIAPPMEIPGWDLTIALFADPDGHVIGLSKGVGAAES